MGYVPCNMVAEVAVDSPVERQQLFQRGYLSLDVLSEGSGMTCGCPVPTSPTHSPTSNSAPPEQFVCPGWPGASSMQSPAEPAALQRLRPVWPQQQACRVEQGSAAEGLGHVVQMLELRNGRGMPFRDLSMRSQAQIKEEIPESLSYSPSPASVSFLYNTCFSGSGNGPFVYATARTAGPPPKPRRSKKGG